MDFKKLLVEEDELATIESYAWVQFAAALLGNGFAFAANDKAKLADEMLAEFQKRFVASPEAK